MCHTFKTPGVLLLPFLLMTNDCVVFFAVMTSYLYEAACVCVWVGLPLSPVCVFSGLRLSSRWMELVGLLRSSCWWSPELTPFSYSWLSPCRRCQVSPNRWTTVYTHTNTENGRYKKPSLFKAGWRCVQMFLNSVFLVLVLICACRAQVSLYKQWMWQRWAIKALLQSWNSLPVLKN